MITAVYYIPRQDDCAALTGDGPCGSAPPTVTHGNPVHDRSTCEGWGPYTGDCACGTRALALCHGGDVILDGCDRAARLAASTPGAPVGLSTAYSVAEAEALALRLERERGGCAVILRVHLEPTLGSPCECGGTTLALGDKWA